MDLYFCYGELEKDIVLCESPSDIKKTIYAIIDCLVFTV